MALQYMTQEGLDKLKKELAEAIAQRPVISAAIAEARDKGDLSENAEYEAAREAQGLLELNIAKLQNLVANAEAVQTVDDGRDAVFLLALLVGIFDTQQENAARLMSAALVDQRCENAADVQEAGGAGGETGDHCAFGQFSLGVDLFTILLCSCLDMGE